MGIEATFNAAWATWAAFSFGVVNAPARIAAKDCAYRRGPALSVTITVTHSQAFVMAARRQIPYDRDWLRAHVARPNVKVPLDASDEDILATCERLPWADWAGLANAWRQREHRRDDREGHAYMKRASNSARCGGNSSVWAGSPKRTRSDDNLPAHRTENNGFIRSKSRC